MVTQSLKLLAYAPAAIAAVNPAAAKPPPIDASPDVANQEPESAAYILDHPVRSIAFVTSKPAPVKTTSNMFLILSSTPKSAISAQLLIPISFKASGP